MPANLSDRIQSLTPKQQELLHKRLSERTSEADEARATVAGARSTGKVDFSLFFFSADGHASEDQRYRLLFDSARFADANGFAAIWTPERHFQAFGGLYPNPGVLSGALAMITERLQIRAGSLVLPLHSPVRVAEDWALVDNLSRGRAGISFATGWHEHDYVIAPGNYKDRRELMFENIAVVRRLWAGEGVELPGVDGKRVMVRTLPRPVQQELPVWVTVASTGTWRRAGEIGANVLTAFSTSAEELRQNIASYRKARLDNGYDPRTGTVSLMLHTYVGADIDEVREEVRGPLRNYLQTYISQFQPMVAPGMTDPSLPEIQGLLDVAFEHYFEKNSLLGPPGKCASIIEKVVAAGVNDLACLLDFGLEYEKAMEGLHRLADLRRDFGSKDSATATGQGD